MVESEGDEELKESFLLFKVPIKINPAV